MTGSMWAIGSAAVGVAAGWVLGRQGRGGSCVKKILQGNEKWMTNDERRFVKGMVLAGHSRLFSNWPPPGTKDDAKRRLLAKARASVDQSGQSLEQARLDVLVPPTAEERPHKLETHGDIREDLFYWLRDDKRKDQDALDYLTAENKYLEAVMSDTEKLQEELFAEMRGRIQEADQTAPLRQDKYFYYTRTLEGAQYKVHCRRKIPEGLGAPSELDAMDDNIPEEILLDENAEAKNHSFYMVRGLDVSPDHKMLIYGVDTTGNEQYTMHVKDIATGKEMLKEPIKQTSGRMAFSMDNKTIFYVTKDELDRPYKVWKHKIGMAPKTDACVFHEQDDAFYLGIGRTRDDKFLYIHSGSSVTSETRFLDAENPDSEWKVLYERKNDVEYSGTHRGGYFYMDIRDKDRPNSELIMAPVSDPSNQKVLIPHRRDVKIEDFTVSKHFLTLFERKEGLQTATVYRLPVDGSAPEALENGQELEFDEPTYEMGPGSQGDFDSDVLRVYYNSLTTPLSTIDYNLATGTKAVKKVTPVLGGFDSSNYQSHRIWATAIDSTKIPISLVYRKDAVRVDGKAPLLLNAYGSYEITNDPYFSSNRLALLDRGFVFAIAHVRGGGEMGRFWYEDGKYLKKKNTFTDVIACAEELIQQKYCSPDTLCLEGRSAGGLTVGATLNMRPDLFKAAILGVPFVDVLTTMLDETIPLTVIEWEEWGNPSERLYYDYMKSYSPVDNIEGKDYPHLLVTCGLHDPRVAYWEPAKYTAKMRMLKKDDNMLIMKCDMSAGHFSKSGRFDRLKEYALEHAFLLKSLGMVGK